MATLLTLDNVSLSYNQEGVSNTVVSDFSIAVSQGEFVAITGASGSGKSSLLACLQGFLKPTAGFARFEERDIYAFSAEELSKYRNEDIGSVFQFFNLVPRMSALDNVIFPALVKGLSRKEALPVAASLLAEVGLAGKENMTIERLSGGQQQRVAIARSIVNSPRAILADEPTGSLDKGNTTKMIALLDRIRKEKCIALVVVTHDPAVASCADRIVELA